MESFLHQMDCYWSIAAHEVIEFNQFTQNETFLLMGDQYNAADLPKERFSRGEKHHPKGRLLRKISLRLERLLVQSGINVLLLRRLILGIFAKY